MANAVGAEGLGARIRVVDGSAISEPGGTRVELALALLSRPPSLHCDEVIVTGPEVGESFTRFTIGPGDLLIGDRGWPIRKGIRHVVAAGGDVIVRLNLTNVPLLDGTGQPFPLLRRLRQLRGTTVGDWPVTIVNNQGSLPRAGMRNQKEPLGGGPRPSADPARELQERASGAAL